MVDAVDNKKLNVDFEINPADLAKNKVNDQSNKKASREDIQPEKPDKKTTINILSMIESFKELIGRKKKVNTICSYKASSSGNQRTIILECKNCELGESSITDPACRKNIFQILINEPLADRLVLSHLYERDYEMEHLEFLYHLSRFIDNINVYKEVEISGECEEANQWKEWIISIINESVSDPIKAYLELKAKIKSLQESSDQFGHEAYKARFIQVLERISTCVPELENRIKGDKTSRHYYENVIKSLVRPAFSSSRIYTAPPSNTEFLEGYEVQRADGRIMPISIYRLTDRPESLYFAIPLEYNMRPKELQIIESVRRKLMRHRPKDLNFAETANSREYFKRIGKQMLSDESRGAGVNSLLKRSIPSLIYLRNILRDWESWKTFFQMSVLPMFT
ncbi:Uncharacterised protein [uncultured archaeon]|nr:Uncharacterised protein [uncultured archaeon]